MPTMSPDAPVRERATGAPAGVVLPFTPPACLCGVARALAAFSLLVARHQGGDEVEVTARAGDAERTLRIDTSANLPARELVARLASELAPIGPDDAAWEFVAGAHGRQAGMALRVGAGQAELRVGGEAVTPSAALHVLARLQVIAQALAAQPERGVLETPVLTPGERAERIRWNATETDLPHGVCLHAAFEARVDADPGRTAVIHGDEEISYGEMEARANRLAAHLRARGVGPESRVGICVERGPRVVEAILGVLKAGGAYVPLDPTYPAERLAHMLATAAVRVLVTEEALAERLPAGAGTVLLDRDGAGIAAERADRLDGGATPANLAYVIFTSGSTGQPKGIALAHRGVMNNLADLNTRHGIGPDDRVLLLSSLSFDMSVYETL
ncbi:MAG TPA: AMP-binding protein, partial [Longimicrobium sp.]|nr:AMP-binding protein [Longimicrobium sp.]